MTYEEMSRFTYGELSNFTHKDLSLHNIELLIKVLENEDIDLPQSIIDKLYSICSKTISTLEQLNINVPKQIKDIPTFPQSKSVMSEFMKFIRGLILNTGVVFTLVGNIDIDVSKEVTNTTTYTSQTEFDKDIFTTIESIKTNWDFNISFEDFKVTLSPEELD